MKLELKGFSQDVDLSSPDNVIYNLVFYVSDGRLIKLPVMRETTEALIRELYSSKPEPKEEIEESRYEMIEEIAKQTQEVREQFEEDLYPASEDEVESL